MVDVVELPALRHRAHSYFASMLDGGSATDRIGRRERARERYDHLTRAWERRLHLSDYRGTFLRHVPMVMRLYDAGHNAIDIAQRANIADERRHTAWTSLYPGIASPFREIDAGAVRYILLANGKWTPGHRNIMSRKEILRLISEGFTKDELVERFGTFFYRVLGQENMARGARFRRQMRRERADGMGRVIDMGDIAPVVNDGWHTFSMDHSRLGRKLDAASDPSVFIDLQADEVKIVDWID